jgi:hypothetical protein
LPSGKRLFAYPNAYPIDTESAEIDGSSRDKANENKWMERST